MPINSHDQWKTIIILLITIQCIDAVKQKNNNEWRSRYLRWLVRRLSTIDVLTTTAVTHFHLHL
jgi:hypothetical protein